MFEPSKTDRFLMSLFPQYGEWLEKQTKQGSPPLRVVRAHVYAIRASGTQYVKLGYTTDPELRLQDLQVSTPFPLEFFGLWIVSKRSVERQVHKEFRHLRKQGEWFQMSNEDLQKLVTFMEPYNRVK